VDFNTGYKRGFLCLTLRHWLLYTNVRAYGSGRAAILDILRYLARTGIKRLWMPAWQCDELICAIKKAGIIHIDFYEGDGNFLPKTDFMKSLNPRQDSILLVDYFGSVEGQALSNALNSFNGPIILDAVHSWLLSDLSKSLKDNVFVVSGFRKIFWKIAGALVTGAQTQNLPSYPGLIPNAAPGFPGNSSLAPRYGILTRPLLALQNLAEFDQIAESWGPSNCDRGEFDSLRCPVMLEQISRLSGAEGVRWEWPNLSQDLGKNEMINALNFKNKFRVISRRLMRR
jgi:hypothetical protein